MFKYFFSVLILGLAGHLAQAETQCSYVVEDPCIWDYAPGTLTLNGVEYECKINFSDSNFAQECRAKDQTNTTVYSAVVDPEHTQVEVYTNPDDLKSLICTGTAVNRPGSIDCH